MAEQRSNSVPLAQIVHRNKANRQVSLDYRGADWKDVAGTISLLKRGAMQDHWMDLASHMLMVDGHLRTVHDTRINGVLSADLVFEPASDSEIDKAGADFARESYESTPHRKEFLYHMLYAESVGWTAAEAVYKRKRAMWHIEPVVIRPRDVRVDPDWYYEIRTYAHDSGFGSEDWIATKERRDKWIIHAPTSGSDTVLTAGDLIACAPSWFFKKEIEIGWLNGLERYANGILIAKHPSGARTETIGALQSMLENLSFSHGATVEDTVDIQHIAGQMDSTAYDQAVTHFENVQSKILLGSTLNTDVAPNGGNRALGESQFATTTLPRLEVIADRLAETLSRDWFAPLLKFNASAFGGVPAAPRVSFKIMGDVTPSISRDGIDAGTVTKNELRAAQGLQEWTDEEGGNDVAKIEVAPAAAFSESASEVAAPRPFPNSQMSAAEQMSLPLTRRSTSATGGLSTMERARLQIEGLESHELLPSKGQ